MSAVDLGLPLGMRLENYVSPCAADPYPFEYVVEGHKPGTRNSRTAVAECRAACGRCEPEHAAWCLRVNLDGPGIIAGLDEDQRASLKRKLEAAR